MRSFVYTITHKASGKTYVGKSNTPERRWYMHQRAVRLGDPKKTGTHLYDSMRKYGIEAFEFKIVKEFDDEKTAFNEEDLYAEALKRSGVTLLNERKGGDGGWAVSEKTRAKMQEAARKVWSNPLTRAARTNENSSNAKLNWKLVREIRTSYVSAGTSIKDLAQQYGMSYGQIHKVVRYLAWYPEPDKDFP